MQCCARIFVSFGLLKRFKIGETTLRNFLFDVAANYHANAYHNFAHGVDVLHCAFMYLKETSMLEAARWVWVAS